MLPSRIYVLLLDQMIIASEEEITKDNFDGIGDKNEIRVATWDVDYKINKTELQKDIT